MIMDKFTLSDATCGPLILTVTDLAGASVQGITVDLSSGSMAIDSS